MKGIFGAGTDTVAAADALHAVRLSARIDIHLAGSRAGAAVDAGGLVEVHADKREAVEESLKST